jgi:hypothetical protein
VVKTLIKRGGKFATKCRFNFLKVVIMEGEGARVIFNFETFE